MTLAILPGARVRADGVLVGTVERAEPPPNGEGSEPLALVVRADGDSLHYRFPLDLIQGVGEERDQAVVHAVVQLAVGAADLDRYRVVPDLVPGLEHSAETMRIPLAAEELVPQTRPIQLGTVRLHKGVETVEQRLRAPVGHDEVVVERIPADQYDASAPADPDETIIPIVEERLIVETRPVVVEYVRVRKQRVTEEREVRGPVRREVVTVEEQRADDADPGHPLVRWASPPPSAAPGTPPVSPRPEESTPRPRQGRSRNSSMPTGQAAHSRGSKANRPSRREPR